MHESSLQRSVAGANDAGSMHAASAHALSTTTLSSHATGTTTSGNPSSTPIGASYTAPHQHQSSDVAPPMHAHPEVPVATAPNHLPPPENIAGGQHAVLPGAKGAGAVGQTAAMPQPGADAGAARRESAAVEVDTFDLSHTAAALMPPPVAGAPVEAHMDFLQQQLDCIGVERPILDGLLLLGDGGHQRRQGGALPLCSCKLVQKP